MSRYTVFPIKGSMTLAKSSRIILKILYNRALSTKEGLAGDRDPEFLHQLRVSLRSIHSYISTMKGLYSSGRAAELKNGIKELARITNRLRDLDVFLIKFDSYSEELSTVPSGQLRALKAALAAERAIEYKKTVTALTEKRLYSQLEEWALQLETTPFDGPYRENSLSHEAAKRTEALIESLLKQAPLISESDPNSDKELHKLRITFKKLRYILTILNSLLKNDTLLRKTKRWQNLLGDYVDLPVELNILSQLSSGTEEAGAGLTELLIKRVRLVKLVLLDEIREFLSTIGKKEERRELIRWR